MPVTFITIAEIKQRRVMLVEQAARIPPGPEQDGVLAEIELLRRLLEIKQSIGTGRPEPMTCSPPSRPPARRAPTQPSTPVKQLQYAEFRSLPCRYDDAWAWLYVQGGWQRIDIADQRKALVRHSKASFKWLFGTDLPPLPHAAFQSSGERGEI